MNYENVIYLPINISNCEGAWQKLRYCHKRKSLLYLKQWISSLSDMHIIVVPIDLVYKSKISDIHENTVMESRNASLFQIFFDSMKNKVRNEL